MSPIERSTKNYSWLQNTSMKTSLEVVEINSLWRKTKWNILAVSIIDEKMVLVHLLINYILIIYIKCRCKLIVCGVLVGVHKPSFL